MMDESHSPGRALKTEPPVKEFDVLVRDKESEKEQSECIQHQHDEEEDPSEGSIESFSTLFSILSADSYIDRGQQQDDQHAVLLHTFKKRNKILKEICKGQSPDLVHVLEENERIVQEAAMRPLRGKENSLQFDASRVHEMTPLTAVQPSLFARLKRVLLLEIHHTLPGYAIICLYCLIHLSLFDMVSMFIEHLTWGTKTDSADEIIYCVLLAIGLTLCRAGGTIWDHYVGNDTYRRVKFDMHNRLRRGDSDARLLLWFRKHTNVAALVDLLGFYIVLVIMNHVQEHLMYQFDMRKSLLESIPSASYDNVITLTKERLSFGLSTYESVLRRIDETQEGLLRFLTDQDEEYLETKLSVSSFKELMGNEEAVAIDTKTQMLFYLFCSIVPAIVLLYKWNYHFEVH